MSSYPRESTNVVATTSNSRLNQVLAASTESTKEYQVRQVAEEYLKAQGKNLNPEINEAVRKFLKVLAASTEFTKEDQERQVAEEYLKAHGKNLNPETNPELRKLLNDQRSFRNGPDDPSNRAGPRELLLRYSEQEKQNRKMEEYALRMKQMREDAPAREEKKKKEYLEAHGKDLNPETNPVLRKLLNDELAFYNRPDDPDNRTSPMYLLNAGSRELLERYWAQINTR